VIAILIAGYHVVWSVVVLVGWAQPILDFICGRTPLEPMAAVALVVIRP
jgi:hypothetical protein